MAKVITCTCGFIVRGQTDDELVTNAKNHVQTDHPDMVGKISPEEFLAMAEEQ